MERNDDIYLACCHALKIKSMGYNCAQACLGGLSQHLELGEGDAMKLMAAFGGGMRHQQLCGAVAGAGVALGLTFGTSEYDKKADDRLGELTVEFVDRFKQKLGTTVCGELLTNTLEQFHWDMPADIGFISEPENAFHIKAPICGVAITSAVEIVLEIIQRETR
jgi:C_GCAxxG_C_C family probable redox protein